MNESDFRPPLCTYRLNWARRTYWRWWDVWDDTALQTQNSSPCGLRPNTLPLGTEAPYNIKSLWVSGEEKFCFFEIWRPEWGSNRRSSPFQAGSFNHCTRPPALGPYQGNISFLIHLSKGSCQVKKNQKIREKLGLVRQHPPSLLTNFFFLKHVKKKEFGLGLDPTTHFRVFLEF